MYAGIVFYSSYLLCVAMFWVFFFFKQKTAYEMRISDWSSDVCSSDLGIAVEDHEALGADGEDHGGQIGRRGLRRHADGIERAEEQDRLRIGQVQGEAAQVCALQ